MSARTCYGIYYKHINVLFLMCDSKSARNEEKEAATLSPGLSGNQHLMLSK